MKNPALHWVRLPLQAVENCRELGGYATNEGQQTAWRTFLRSSDLTNVTAEDVAFLQQYGLAHVMDLRAHDEITAAPNPFANVEDVTYTNVSLIQEWVGNLALSDSEFTLGHLYVQMLQNGDGIAQVLTTMSQQQGVTLFHCAAGKDRTGVIAMLLLALAGVAKQDIISNYEVTHTNLVTLREQFAHIRTQHPNIKPEMMYSKPEYIEEAYDYIIATYGTVERYLQHIGMTDEAIAALRTRIVLQQAVSL